MLRRLLVLTALLALPCAAQAQVGPSIWYQGPGGGSITGLTGGTSLAATVPLLITGTTASDGPTIGAELLDATGWTTVDWTGSFAAGWDHTTGNTTALLNSLAAESAAQYVITTTVSGRTAGTFNIQFGGVVLSFESVSGVWAPTAISTGSLIVTPTTDFDGAIVFSIKKITGMSTPLFSLKSSDGTVQTEMRAGPVVLADSSNVFVGKRAGAYNLSQGLDNVGVGFESMYFNTEGLNNTAIGFYSMRHNTTGGSNTGLGTEALRSNTSGSDNVAVGFKSLLTNSVGSQNTSFGTESSYLNTSDLNTAFGYRALRNSTTGSKNVAIGPEALYTASSGANENVAVGYRALYSSTTADQNVAVGSEAMLNNTGASNTAVGFQAMMTNGASFGNTAVGNSALYSTAASGNNNTAMGVIALYAVSSGDENTGFGREALSGITTASSNTAIGFAAGAFITGGATANVTSGTSTYLGHNTKASASGNANETVIGYNATGGGSNTVTLGNGSVTSILASDDGGATITASAYKVGANTGVSGTVIVKGSDGNNCNLVFEGGILTSETCP